MSATVALVAPIAVGWMVAVGYCYQAMRRRRRMREEWEAAAAGLRDLDRELDEVWASGQPRRRP